MPKEFPVYLDEFLRLVIGGKSRGNRLGIYRIFVRDRVMARIDVTRTIRSLRSQLRMAPGARPPVDEEVGCDETFILGQIESEIKTEKSSGFSEEGFIFLRAELLGWISERRKEKAKKAANARWKNKSKKS